MTMTGEHAEDVLRSLHGCLQAGQPCALVIVVSTEGGAVRAPGALMAVSETSSTGYISGGCIDADVILQARQAASEHKPRSLRYGAGSPFVDLPLPCGGAIDLVVIPNPDPKTIYKALTELIERRVMALHISEHAYQLALHAPGETPQTGTLFSYTPKLRLRIAGRGADALALAMIAEVAGYAVLLQLIDDEDIESARCAGLANLERLETPSQTPTSADDAWTAFVLLFHDRDWEIPLLKQALSGAAFYVGAVGSRRTHANRCDALRHAGCTEAQIDRIYGPIGLVPSLRNASMLAVSALAEIVGAYQARYLSGPPRTGFLLLAAGASSRFENGDKLLADLLGQTVLERASGARPSHGEYVSVAVVDAAHSKRASVLRERGWEIVVNPDSKCGQSSSISVGIQALFERDNVDQVIILLGDMPNVPARHCSTLLARASNPDTTAIMSAFDDQLSPPALFKREHFEALLSVSGDRGAKSVFVSLVDGAETVLLPVDQACDVDTVADLERVKEAEHA